MARARLLLRLDHHAIAGRLEDLARLAALVEVRLAAAHPGDTLRLGQEYGGTGDHDLVLEVAPDGFDPASADPQCAAGSTGGAP